MNATTPNFTRLFDSTLCGITFKEEWKNGTGYLDGLREEDLQFFVNEKTRVETVRTIDDYGRRVLIIVGHGCRNQVFFERYSKEGTVIVSNIGMSLRDDLDGNHWQDSTFQETYTKAIRFMFKKTSELAVA